MRHLSKGRKLSRRKDHRKAILANLAVSLIKNGRIQTTDAKAKEVRPFVERMVTFARRGDLHARRIVLARLKDASAVKKLFDEIGPQYINRFGGYTRIIKLGFRQGDNSPVSLIEFVKEDETKKVTGKRKSPKDKAKIKPSKTPEMKTETLDAVEAEKSEIAEDETIETLEEKASNVEEAGAEEVVEESSPEETEEKEVTTEQAKKISPVKTTADSEEKSENDEVSADEKENSA